MIAALLHGRTHLNFQEFRQQNHLTFFLHVLGVLELLQPQVFQSEHQGALWDCLRSFVRLLLVGLPPAWAACLSPQGGGAPPGWGGGAPPAQARVPLFLLCPLAPPRLPPPSARFCPHSLARPDLPLSPSA